MTLNNNSYQHKIFFGALFMLTGGLGKNIIAFGVNLILARLLTPSDFGSVAIVVSIISILKIFAELGTSVALVQRKTITLKIKDSAFTATLVVTLTFIIILWISANTISNYFNNKVLKDLIHIAAFSYVFLGIFSLYRSLLLRDLRYKAISVIEFIGVIISSVVTVSLACFNIGPSSIVWGQLASAGCLLFLGFALTRYVPKSLGDWSSLKELFSFGIWVSLSRVLGNASGQFDKFIIGKLIDPGTLGGYYLAQKIVMILPSIFTGVIDQVMLPIYSQWQDSPSRIEKGYWKGLRISALLVLPAMALLAAIAHPLIYLLLGQAWCNIVPLIQIFCIFGAIQGLGGGIFGSVIYASGKPQTMILVNAFRIIMLPLCVFIGSFSGILGISYGMVAFGIIGRLFNQYILTRIFNFKFSLFFSTIALPITINIVIYFLTIKISLLSNNLILSLFISSLFFTLCYIVTICILFTDDFLFIKNSLLTRR
ncbi:lipopolysaccharide biosynthesis protein [Desulfoplanes formicivorans]|uniref:Lipopolysaccharide biosynthesis protein n=1 Tax=Desulfoplanes formicivorans TaxID=1592317 RepID=A0A194AEU0_9BACT|nr:lipopolysaccharide biosynthesis protein [Desulfoplanes formicivorans]GAU07616.1 lipopolysaccharide biosynthesis protein [Desulfoplanes formicivorans]